MRINNILINNTLLNVKPLKHSHTFLLSTCPQNNLHNDLLIYNPNIPLSFFRISFTRNRTSDWIEEVAFDADHIFSRTFISKTRFFTSSTNSSILHIILINTQIT